MDFNTFINLYNSKKTIGKGVKGVVKEWCVNVNCDNSIHCIDCIDCEKYVIKSINVDDVNLELLLKVFRLTHDLNIFPKLYNYYQFPQLSKIFIVMERINLSYSNDTFNLHTLIKNIITKIHKLHNLNIYHSDLNNRNVILSNNNIYIVDVDSCKDDITNKHIINDLTTLLQTILYKLNNKHALQKPSKSITNKFHENKRKIIKLYKQYIKELYSNEIYIHIH
jgi:tRNA A-37 threonylcarbamoyl transferase component Bud32